MQQLAQNNLFTAFNNIEKIKEERKVKPVIRKVISKKLL